MKSWLYWLSLVSGLVNRKTRNAIRADFPEAATLEDFIVRNRTGRELCALSSAYVVQLDTHFLAMVQPCTAESMCASSKLCSSTW